MRILAAALTGLMISYQGISVSMAETAEDAPETVDTAAPAAEAPEEAPEDASAGAAPDVPVTETESESEAALTDSPEAIVDTLHAGLLDIMQGGDDMGFDGRLEHISPIIEDTFDVTALAASAIGLPVWRKWDDDQKRGYVQAFRAFLTTNYASQFKSFSGQAFETLKVDDGPRGTKIVRTHLMRPDDDPVALDYVLRERNDSIGITDVFLDGSVSEAARRRAEFTAVYRDQGYDGLIASIEDLVAENKARTDGDITESETSDDQS